MTGGPAAMLTLFVLVVIIAAGLATFFRHKVTALAALLAVPIALFLNAALGGLYTLLLITVGVMVALLLNTISDTVRILRAADAPNPRARYARPERREARRRSERSRVAA
jgi:hypothetical protein